MSPTAKHGRRFGDERGFSLIQVIIVLGIMGVLAGMAVFGIRSARYATRLNNSARDFAQYAEKARLDAIRRRTTTHIEFTGPSNYEVTMDFTGDGISETRSFSLEEGIVLTDSNGTTVSSTSTDLPWADFDWRGRTYECNMLFPLKNTRSDQIVVQVAGSGDITVNSSITGLPTVTYTNVNTTADVNPSATLSGSDLKVNLSPCGTITATPTPTPTPTATPTPETPDENPPCSLAVTPTSLDNVKRKGGNTASLSVVVNQPGSITTTVNSNLELTASGSETITASGGGTVNYTVASGTNSWGGPFPIKFEFANCSPVTVNVTVVK